MHLYDIFNVHKKIKVFETIAHINKNYFFYFLGITSHLISQLYLFNFIYLILFNYIKIINSDELVYRITQKHRGERNSSTLRLPPQNNHNSSAGVPGHIGFT